MRLIRCFSILVVAAVVAGAEPMIRELREHLPFHAALVREHTPVGETVPLPAGTPLVVLREEDGLIVADVSRRGRYRFPIDATDALALAEKARAETGGRAPERSRMVMFVGNKLVSGESGWTKPLPAVLTHPWRTWIFLYADAAGEAAPSLVAEARRVAETWPQETRGRVGLVFMDTRGSAEAIAALGAAAGPHVTAMPAFLSKAYLRGFAHFPADVEPKAALVAVDAAGSIVARGEGVAITADFWADAARSR